VYELVLLLFVKDTLLIRVVPLIFKGVSTTRRYIVEHKFSYVAVALFVIVFFLGSLVAVFEQRDPNANIRTIGEGVWWSIETITTVGYGDRFPVTWAGRIIGTLLMAFGITGFSLLTAGIASFLVGEKEEKEMTEVHQHLDRIEKKLEALQKQLIDSGANH
jgi:voltage-gated potassium channel